jgi:formylglycine-generating enzyme required for sulfatase activity
MTIARNIEGQNSNWYNPTPTPVNQVGNGGLWRGHSDDNPPNALAASTDDNAGYTDTNNDPTSANGWSGWQEKRTHTLSNGEVIWDLSGNVWEWTNDIISARNSPSGGVQGLNHTQFTSITSYGNLSYDLVRPSDTSWNSSQNMGGLLSYGNSNSITNYAIERGSDWSPGGATPNPGIFGMAIWRNLSSTSYAVGFRCVMR